MPSFSTITILGYVGNIRTDFTKKGNKITTFTVAVNRKRGQEEATDWYNVKTTADWVDSSIDKGDLVLVIGEPQSRLYNEKVYWDIWANTIKVLTRKEQVKEATDEPPF